MDRAQRGRTKRPAPDGTTDEPTTFVRADRAERDASLAATEPLLVANERLRELDRLRADFMSATAHELRTPLTPILMRIQFLRRADLTDEQRRDSLDVIERNLQRFSALVGQLVDVARLERGAFVVRPQRADLTEIARLSVESFRDAAERAGVRLQLSHPGPLPLWADAHRLAQIFANLLSNAIKFTRPGGSVTLVLSGGLDSVAASVTDTGRGLSEATKRRLFQPFMQGQPGPSGAGLGLYISWTIVREHGGTLEALSDGEHCGSTFRFTLPRRMTPSTEASVPSQVGPNGA